MQTLRFGSFAIVLVLAQQLAFSLLAAEEPVKPPDQHEICVLNFRLHFEDDGSKRDVSSNLEEVLAGTVATTLQHLGLKAYTIQDLKDQLTGDEIEKLLHLEPGSVEIDEVLKKHGFGSRMWGHVYFMKRDRCVMGLTWWEKGQTKGKEQETSGCSDTELMKLAGQLAKQIVRVEIVFESEPPGATVEIDGKPLAQRTPCKEKLAKGKHKVRMHIERHEPREEVVDINHSTEISWELTPSVGWLSVTSEPSGLKVDVLLDGKKWVQQVTTPYWNKELEPGTYVLRVNDERYEPAEESVVVKVGKEATAHLTPQTAEVGFGKLAVSAYDASKPDHELRARVTVDGSYWGTTPGTWVAGPGKHDVKVELDGFNTKTITVRVKRGETCSKRIGLTPKGPPDGKVCSKLSSCCKAYIRMLEKMLNQVPGVPPDTMALARRECRKARSYDEETCSSVLRTLRDSAASLRLVPGFVWPSQCR